MDMNSIVRLMQLLPVRKEHAICARDLTSKWFDGKVTDSNLRRIQRYLASWSLPSIDGPSLVVLVDGPPNLYYLDVRRVNDWLLSEEAALNILLTRQILSGPFGTANQMDTNRLIDLAEEKAGTVSLTTQRIRDLVRIVPDGLGRAPAQIDPAVRQIILDALTQQKKVKFTYKSPQGRESTVSYSPQGLVAKDGTLYLLCTKYISDPPIHYALHRMLSAELSHEALIIQPDFDLDSYIVQSHTLSHTLTETPDPVELKLRVAKQTVYHFIERKLEPEQIIGDEIDGWSIVTAKVPVTILLVPFLLSMGAGVEVLGPPEIRSEMATRVQAMAAHYRP